MRVVIELKRDASAGRAQSALSLFRAADEFGVNMLALNGGRPLLMNLKEMIAAFVLSAKSGDQTHAYELTKARDRPIRSSPSPSRSPISMM